MYRYRLLHLKKKSTWVRLYSFNLDAIRTRYRISKHHYTTFYKDFIQDTLASCIYNEGTRKPKKQAMVHHQQQQRQDNSQQDEQDE